MLKCLLVLIYLWSPASAIINGISFKGITKQFKPEFIMYSPLIGKLALDTGLIYNLRFFGNLTEGHKDGSRDYARDQGLDALTQLLIVLFPSPAGELASQSAHVNNFGKGAAPEIVAQLLKFAQVCREPIQRISALKKEIKDIESAKAEFFQNLAKSTEPESEKSTKTKEYVTTAKNQKTEKNKNIKIVEDEIQCLMNTFAPNLQQILMLIRDSLYCEMTQESPYPQFTTEQVILAFFCHKFNTREDIQALLDNFPEFILHPAPRLDRTDAWTQENIKDASLDRNDLDYIFANNFLNLGAPVPYGNGISPASNGACPVYDRATNETKDHTFADCVETMIRHFANIMLFRQATQSFDLELIASLSPSLGNFYSHQPPRDADNGSQKMRGQWNAVVGDLNYEGTNSTRTVDIHYNNADSQNPQFNIQSGYRNFIRIWEKILNRELNGPYPSDNNLEAKKAWLEESIRNLCQILHPRMNCEITLENITEQPKDTTLDLFGNLLFQTNDFSFAISAQNGHMGLDSITYAEGDKRAIPLDPASIPATIPATLELINKTQITQPIYKLMAQGEFTSDEHKFTAINGFMRSFNAYLNQFSTYFANILKSANVDDDHTRKTYLSLVARLLKPENPEPFKTTMARSALAGGVELLNHLTTHGLSFESIKYLHLKSAFEPVLDLTQATALKNLVVDDNGKLGRLGGLNNLENLQIFGEIALIDLTGAHALRTLGVYGKVNDLNLSDANNLKALTIGWTGSIETLEGLENLEYLNIGGIVKTLDLQYAKNHIVIGTGSDWISKVTTFITLPGQTFERFTLPPEKVTNMALPATNP